MHSGVQALTARGQGLGQARREFGQFGNFQVWTRSLFPDVLEGMLALKGKLTLALLSNGDLDSLEQAVSGLSIPVDSVVSAEQAGVYKPHSAVYRFAAEYLNLPPDQILHVAAHPWDVRGAKAFGLLGAYINREGIPYGEAGPPLGTGRTRSP